MAKEYTGKTPFTLPRPLFYKNGVNIKTIASSDFALTYFDSQYQILLDPGSTAGLIITLPELKNGAWFVIKNNSAGGNFVIKDAAAATIKSLPNTESILVVCDGSEWAATLSG